MSPNIRMRVRKPEIGFSRRLYFRRVLINTQSVLDVHTGGNTVIRWPRLGIDPVISQIEAKCSADCTTACPRVIHGPLLPSTSRDSSAEIFSPLS
ncbi:hypothetical protein PoB_003973900 [Plakobranchus ocellatus]|uniref:Uncharacterized protein n=1 Tax=Plakobranchus ocellatus TaxID=259542 RepID=A0AAV4AZR0_9GAST|nr:hypothetical protein PoB_003973900 [Plakobranchus ocellatus]